MSLRRFAPALVLLGVCVFAWGLRYKLSFYAQPHSMTHKMAEAKLLLTDRSSVPAIGLRRTSHGIAPLVISLWIPALLLVAAMNFRFGREWLLDRVRVPASPGWLWCAPAFIRPPPRS